MSASNVSLKRYLSTVRNQAAGGSKVIDSPWPSLNKMIFFLRPEETVIVAARTSVGKTFWVINWAHYLASKGIKTLFITKEMSSEGISDRFECLKYGLPYAAFRSACLPPKLLRKWKRARQNDIEDYPLIISGEETIEGVGLEHVTSKIHQYDPEVVFIDGAYLINPEGLNKRASPVERFSYISNRAKAIAKAKKKIIFLVIQMNREAEHADGAVKGSIKTIYGADAWAQDADYVFDLGGIRGSKQRTVTLLKGRESVIGEFNIRFQLDPPNFKEVYAGGSSTASPNFNRI